MEDPYKIDYEDEKFTQVEEGKEAALNRVEETYGGMLQQADDFYDAQTQAVKDWEEKQSALQQEQTDFTLEQLQQQKDQAEKDYVKEQSAAYTDWQKQSGAYGVNAEQQAALGMQNTGYSESSRVGMYNAYQNRVATAKAAFTQAVTVYDNAMKEATLQNNAAMAELAYQSLQQQLALSLQGFQYRNQLALQQMDHTMAVENQYYGRYQDVLHQMNTENALAEQIRQHNEQLAEQQRQFNYKHKLGEFAGRSSGGPELRHPARRNQPHPGPVHSGTGPGKRRGGCHWLGQRPALSVPGREKRPHRQCQGRGHDGVLQKKSSAVTCPKGLSSRPGEAHGGIFALPELLSRIEVRRSFDSRCPLRMTRLGGGYGFAGAF